MVLLVIVVLIAQMRISSLRECISHYRVGFVAITDLKIVMD